MYFSDSEKTTRYYLNMLTSKFISVLISYRLFTFEEISLKFQTM